MSDLNVPERIYNVLFLCTGNSARSIMAEAIANREHSGRFTAFSAGSHPTGTVNPHVLQILQHIGCDTAPLRSKSWDEFAAPGAPRLDFVITVCDNAAGEVCPVWPGQPITAHWGIPDPASVTGAAAETAVIEAYLRLQRRIGAFAALPIDSLDRLSLEHRLREIGDLKPPPEEMT